MSPGLLCIAVALGALAPEKPAPPARAEVLGFRLHTLADFAR